MKMPTKTVKSQVETGLEEYRQGNYIVINKGKSPNETNDGRRFLRLVSLAK